MKCNNKGEKMKKRYWMIAVLTLILLASIILPACAKKEAAPAPTPAPAPAPAPVAVKTMKISYSCPKGKGYSSGEEWFGPEFEKRTNGRYKVEVYGMSTLVPINAVLDSVRKGVCQIGLTSTAMFAKDFPLSMVTMTPTMGWPGADQAMYDASDAAWTEFSKIPEVAAELNNGFTYLTNDILNGSNLVMLKAPVHYPADFKGHKISASGGLTDVVTANGGAAVAVVGPENYTNLEKGVIDGSFMSMTMATDWKVDSLADYYYMMDFGCGNMIALMNTDFYNSMSAEDKTIFAQVRKESYKPLIDFEINSYKGALEILKKDGKTLTYPTADEYAAWKKATYDIVIPKWKADAKSVGVSEETCNKVLDQWLAIRAKYWKQYNIPGEP
jgi:TRAP-type C4-dicarboxylate transport system substrate-binding protein